MKKEIARDAYKNLIEESLRNEKDEFCPFRKETQMDYLFKFLEKDFYKNESLKILDACCGYGRLIHFLNELNEKQNYTGIDYVEELINDGIRNFVGKKNIKFELYDVMALSDKYYKEFDIAINYKTLSWLPNYTTIIEQLIKATKQKVYITSLFYDGDIDFITKIFVNEQNSNENKFSYLNTYSYPKFKRYCISLGVKEVNSINMNLDFDLEKDNNINKLHTYTIPTKSGNRLEITGNVILNWKLIEIVL